MLSELHGEWTAAVQRWSRLNASLRRDLPDGAAPGMSAQLMLYQTLVGAWPLGLAPEDEAGVAAFLDRVAAWQEKALREAKRRTEWAVPNAEYEAACRDFITAIMAPDRASHMRAEIAAFAARIAPAGAINGLSQALLRCTAPGVPDLYQGTEFWDFSLVDPDNRRPVDWAARRAALDAAVPAARLLEHWQDGRVKQAVIAGALALRAARPALFAEGDYLPVSGGRPARAARPRLPPHPPRRGRAHCCHQAACNRTEEIRRCRCCRRRNGAEPISSCRLHGRHGTGGRR